ncbi:MAG: tetratricopeptide repeat protein [Parachlamydiales bacterium]|jgi:tetratricopeptide (TPR) repeat protein
MTKIHPINTTNRSYETTPMETSSTGMRSDQRIGIKIWIYTTVGNSTILKTVSRRVHTTLEKLSNISHSRQLTKPNLRKHSYKNHSSKIDSSTQFFTRTPEENCIYNALMAANQNDWEKAEEFFIKAVRINPNVQAEIPGLTSLDKQFCKKYYLHFGIAFFKQSFFVKAEDLLKKSFDVSIDPTTCSFLEKCYSIQGKHQQWLECLEKAKDIEPNNIEIKNAYDDALQKTAAIALTTLFQNCEKLNV